MGAHYQSLHFRRTDAPAVHAFLTRACAGTELRFWVASPTGPWISAFPSDMMGVEELCAKGSEELTCDVLHTILHDSDLFAYTLYRGGRADDEFCSDPDYFKPAGPAERHRLAGQPEKLASLVTSADGVDRLRGLLHDPGELEAEMIMQLFMDELGITQFLSDYQYLEGGEHDTVTDWKKFVHLPDRAAEKAARKAEEARQKAVKRQLIELGELVADSELLKPRATYRSVLVIGPDPESGGFLLTNLFRHTLYRWAPPNLPCEVTGENARKTETTALGYDLVKPSLIREFGPRLIVRHPSRPLLFASIQRALLVLDGKGQRIVQRLEMTNPQLVPKKSAQWQKAGINPAKLPGLDREDLFDFEFSPDGETLAAGTSEGLRIYRTADILAAKDTMPLPCAGVETSRKLQDYRFAGGVRFVPVGDDLQVLYVSRDETVRRYSWRSQVDSEVAGPIADYSAFSLHISGDGRLVAATMRARLEDPRRRDDFVVRIWPLDRLAGAPRP